MLISPHTLTFSDIMIFILIKVKGVNCFERKIQQDPSSCTRLSKIKNVIRRISTR